MSKKRPLAPPASPTDEWGIYDPAKAGMQALYSRLGRPILRASAASERRERKRASRPERPADGVGMAIQEAKRRAGLITAAQAAPPPAPLPEPLPEPVPVPVAVPVVPVAAPVAVETAAPVPVPETAATPRKKSRTKAAKVTKRRQLGDDVVAAAARSEAGIPPKAAAPPPPPEPPPAPPVVAAEPLPQRRAVRKPVRGRQAANGAAAAPAPKSTPVIPPPSPRRPRGAVPLAAWAHAVSDSSRAEAKRSEAKGLWRGIFRIPSDVALVAYGRGCRIHRLVIETSADALADPF